MGKLTSQKETATRKKVDTWLINLGWVTDEDDPTCNVTTERALTEEQNELIKPNEPDYVLYKSDTEVPLAVIEAKRKGETLPKALKQAVEKYAVPLKIPIVFATDGTFVTTLYVSENKELKIDGEAVNELLSESLLCRFAQEGASISAETKAIQQTREQLIGTFKWANNILRQAGIREGFDRFIEFANLLFLKLISEMELDRSQRGEDRVLEDKYCWDAFKDLPADTMYEYVNGTVLMYLATKYNHSGDVFQTKLQIANPRTLKEIVDKLSELRLINFGSDIKGDAFEYFLKHSVSVGNDLGEYFTPRHIVKLMVELINPQFGEQIYDPTCGTAGFLIYAFNHIKRTCKMTKDTLNTLREKTVYGVELTNTARLAKMNMIITGDGHTNIEQMDCLERPVKDKYDAVLANPPYAQITDYGKYYPVDSKQADSVFLQHIMLSLKSPGRAAVVVPEGVLFRPGADKEVRKLLLKKYDLKSIISLPQQTFMPYARAKTYILIFEKGTSTKKVWFFNIENDGFSLDEKRLPIEDNDLPCLTMLWETKEDSPKSWSATYEDIEQRDFNLSPSVYRPPAAPTKGITIREANTYLMELREALNTLRSAVESISIEAIITNAEKVPISKLLMEVQRPKLVASGRAYETIGVHLYGKGVFSHGDQRVKAKTLNQIRAGDFVYSKLFAWKGAFDVVNEEFDGYYASNEFPIFKPIENPWKVGVEFIKFFFRIRSSWALAGQLSRGTAKMSRNRLSPKDFLSIELPIPPLTIAAR